jgi:hypothetical protein
LFATLTGIALATAASYGFATPQAAVDAVTSAPAPQLVALQSPRAEARAAAPLTLHLEDASGNAVRSSICPASAGNTTGPRGGFAAEKKALQRPPRHRPARAATTCR